MPKRKRPDEVLASPPGYSESDAPIPVLEETTSDHQPRSEANSVTSGNPGLGTTAHLAGEVPAIDVAATELLAASPFWALLLRACYTWV